MAEKSYFFNDVDDDRVYLAEDFAMYFATLIANGVFANASYSLLVVKNEETPMAITIKPGKAWINGYLYINTEDIVKTLEAAYTNPRIDRVVARWSSNSREILIDVITGTPAVAPVAPELTRNSDIWELCIAEVNISGGVTAITQANITDTRLNNDLCGIVHALIDQLDMSTVFDQYVTWFSEKQAQFNSSLINYAAAKQIEIDQTQDNFEQDFSDWLNNKKSEFDLWMGGEKNDFDVWFETVQGILNADTAGNLLSMINSNSSSINVNTEKIEQNEINTLLFDEKIKNTIQELNFSADGNISEIKHMRGETVVRQDVFTISDLLIQETRTLNTGESLTIKNHLQNGFVNEVEVI